MPESTPRIKPLEPPYTPEIEAALTKWMPPGAAVEPLRLFRTLNVNAELASRMLPLGAGILGRTAKVPPPLREIMIHRTSVLTGAEYEGGARDELREAARVDRSAASLNGPRLVDRRLLGGRPGDRLSTRRRAARERHDLRRALAEARGAIRRAADPGARRHGWYHLIGFVCHGLRIEPEEWAASYPSA
jgi:4-carboxymuconolactone decarboxylase